MEIIPFTMTFNSVEAIQDFYFVFGLGLDSIKERIERNSDDPEKKKEEIAASCGFHYHRLRELLSKRDANIDFWDWVRR